MSHKLRCSDLPIDMRCKVRFWKRKFKLGTLDPKVIEAFEQEGIYHLLLTKFEILELNCHNLCKFFLKNKRNPSRKSKDETERKLATFHCAVRQSKIGQNNRIFYPILQVIANSYNLPNLFDITDRKNVYVVKSKQYCQFVKAYNRKPSKRSKNQYEKSLGFWFTNINRTNRKSKQYPKIIMEVIKIFKSFNMEQLLNKKSYKDKAEDACHKLCQFIIKNNKNPTRLSKDKTERLLARWFKRNKYIKTGKSKKGIFYTSLQNIAKSYGFPHLFK